jgi:hypothetical protein
MGGPVATLALGFSSGQSASRETTDAPVGRIEEPAAIEANGARYRLP